MRCIKLTTLAALSIAVSLTLGAAQQEARAGACAKAGENPGCVTSKDVKNNSLKGGKGGDIKNESGANFVRGDPFLEPVPAKGRIYAKLTLTPPTDGRVIINATATLDAVFPNFPNETQGQVLCRIKIGRRFKGSETIGDTEIMGSVSRRYKPLASIAWSGGVKVKGEKKRTIFLWCRWLVGMFDLHIDDPAITAVFHPSN